MARLVHLQSLRALAASAVVAAHALEYPVRRGVLGPDAYRLAWAMGWLGVAVFFVISGLIMWNSAAGQFGAPGAARRFAIRRIVRVVPLYWLATIPFAAALLARGEVLTGDMIVRSLLFIPYAAPGMEAARPIVGQGWTLNYEMLFYALFTLALLCRPRAGLALVLGTFPLLVALRPVIWPLVPYADPVSPLPFWTDPITLLFVAGVLLALARGHAAGWHTVPHPAAASLVVLAGAVALFLASGAGFPLQIGWQALFALAAIATVWLCSSTAGHRWRRLGTGAEALGDASYSTYLFHPLMLMVLHAVWALTPLAALPVIGTALFVCLALVACNIGGWAIFLVVERPLTRRLATLTGRRRPILPVAA